ncbi:MAG: phosphohexomutase domain-containing protein [Planctomycetota bacterium]|jgi:phosphomannomutase
MISISGVRGIIGESLTPELVMRMGVAFGTYLAGRQGPETGDPNPAPRVVVGRDTRVSGEMVKHSVLAGLLSTGCSIIDLGVVTTPTAAIAVEDLKADGGVVISASHNPVEWNALKFFDSDGQYLDAEGGRALLDVYYQGDFRRAAWDEIREVERDDDAAERHLREVLEVVDVEAIRARRFRVALDSCNGAGVEVTARLLEELGCEVLPIHCTPDGLFPHDPEPTFLNLQDLCGLCEAEEVDVGFAQDPDADRLAVVDESGRFIGEEYTLALAADYVLSGIGDRGSGTGGREAKDSRSQIPAPGSPVVVINMSTSRATEDVARRHGARCERVPVGEVNVAGRMRELGAVIGGEGNGGVIDPRVHYGRDSLVGIALILEHMAGSGKRLSELVAGLPEYVIRKTKVDLGRAGTGEALEKLAAEEGPSGARINTDDGLRLDWDAAWVHIRPSNTEPVVRVIAEAAAAEADRLVDEYAGKMTRLAGGAKA